MVDVTVAITNLIANTASADLVGSGTAVTTGQTFSVPANNRSDNFMIVMEETGSTTASIVFDAGDYPPSMNAAKGSLTITFAANDLKVLMVEGGRFIQDTGLITATLTGTARIRAFRLPVGPILSYASTPTAIA